MKKLLITILLASTLWSTAGAATYFVSKTGNDTNAGTSWGAAWQTLQKVNSSTTGGDTTVLATGIFRNTTAPIARNGNSNIAPGLTPRSGTGADRTCIIDSLHWAALLAGQPYPTRRVAWVYGSDSLSGWTQVGSSNVWTLTRDMTNYGYREQVDLSTTVGDLSMWQTVTSSGVSRPVKNQYGGQASVNGAGKFAHTYGTTGVQFWVWCYDNSDPNTVGIELPVRQCLTFDGPLGVNHHQDSISIIGLGMRFGATNIVGGMATGIDNAWQGDKLIHCKFEYAAAWGGINPSCIQTSKTTAPFTGLCKMRVQACSLGTSFAWIEAGGTWGTNPQNDDSSHGNAATMYSIGGSMIDSCTFYGLQTEAGLYFKNTEESGGGAHNTAVSDTVAFCTFNSSANLKYAVRILGANDHIVLYGNTFTNGSIGIALNSGFTSETVPSDNGWHKIINNTFYNVRTPIELGDNESFGSVGWLGKHNVFRWNVVYKSGGGAFSDIQSPVTTYFDTTAPNLYWNGITYQSGWDNTGSLVQDPAFTNGASGNFARPTANPEMSANYAGKGWAKFGAVQDGYLQRYSANQRLLTADQVNPLFINGDAAYSMIAQLTYAQADAYMTDRASRGFNALIVNVIEGYFSDNAPANKAGAQPFTGANFTTPNPAYFNLMDSMVARANALGIHLFLYPVYLGNPWSQGWGDQINSASSSNLASWGTYLGNRYKAFPNIVWVIGGDTDPSSLRTKVDAFTNALKAADNVFPNRLITGHAARDAQITTYYGTSFSENWLNLNNIYTSSSSVITYADAAFDYSSTLPWFLIEADYENEGPDVQTVRRQYYSAILRGGAGYIFGNCPIWETGSTKASNCGTLAGSGWTAQWNSTGSNDMTRCRNLFEAVHWYRFLPDRTGAVITAGAGTGTSQAPFAKTTDSSFIVGYIPSARTVTINPISLRGDSMLARWYNPATGNYSTAGGTAGKYVKGTTSFTSTGSDQVLVINGFGTVSAPPTPNIVLTGFSVTEGTTGQFLATMSVVQAQNVTFTINTASGTATGGVDYTQIVNGIGTIIAGQTSTTVSIPTASDTLSEANETMTCTISNMQIGGVAGGTISTPTATGTIVEDPYTSAGIQIQATASANEGTGSNGSVNFTVTLNHVLGNALTFRITTAGVTATQGTDYTGQTAVLYTIPAGQITVTVPVIAIADATIEPDETFTATIVAASQNYGYVGNAVGTGTITNDDFPAQTGGPYTKVRNL